MLQEITSQNRGILQNQQVEKGTVNISHKNINSGKDNF